MRRGRPRRFVPALLAGCLTGCPQAPTPPVPPVAPPAGVAVRYEGVDVEQTLVEEFVPFVEEFRPGQAPDSIRRHILLSHALPLAWARARRPQEFEAARKRAEEWKASILAGELTLQGLARQRAAEEGAPVASVAPHRSARAFLHLPLARAAFQARPGELVGPIESALGWHLLVVEQFYPGLIRDEDEVSFLEVVSLAGGRDHLEEIRGLRARLSRERELVEIVDPVYSRIVPLYLIRRGPPGEVAPAAADPDR